MAPQRIRPASYRCYVRSFFEASPPSGSRRTSRNAAEFRFGERGKPCARARGDLDPNHRVTGDGKRRVFGVDTEDAMSSDNITLVRAAKPAKKDLPASKVIKGGILRKPVGNDSMTLVRAAKPAKQDLPAGTVIKGGKKVTR
jgi:hypothetical protein